MTQQILAFVAACLVVILMPGPDMMLTVKNTARYGRAGTIWTAAGIMSGLAVLGLAAALGIAGLLAAAPGVFDVLRVVGGLYLLYLGVQALRSYRTLRRAASPGTGAFSFESRTLPPEQRWTCFRQGLLSNLLNPKVLAFYLSLFPQFDLSPLPTVLQQTVLAATFWVLCAAWYLGLIALTRRVLPLVQSPTFARRTEGIAGGALAAVGIAVLVQAA